MILFKSSTLIKYCKKYFEISFYTRACLNVITAKLSIQQGFIFDNDKNSKDK